LKILIKEGGSFLHMDTIGKKMERFAILKKDGNNVNWCKRRLREGRCRFCIRKWWGEEC